jgi:hypothetical protein
MFYRDLRAELRHCSQKRRMTMNSVLSLTGAAHRYRRKDFAAEIRVGER